MRLLQEDEPVTSTTIEWGVIVIGSGIGGLACAAALATYGHRVLVLEQHQVAGGLTHTFTRNSFTFSVGVHYLGDVGPDGTAGGHLRWLSQGAIQMAPLGAVYDTLHFPEGVQVPLSRPEAALRLDLKEKFPASVQELDAYFEALREAQDAGHAAFALRAMPAPLAFLYRLWKGRRIDKWCGRTTQQVLAELIGDPKLHAVLAAQWGDYGGPPNEASFAIHAVVTRDYFNGAYYPIGGPGVFAETLGQTIAGAGGRVQVNAKVTEFICEDEGVVGVRLADGSEYRAPHIVSDIGVRNTIERLLPASLRDSEWTREVLSIHPSIAYVGVYLGFAGDISARGASASNHWFYETWDLNQAVWTDPLAQELAPGMFVSFPSLKDPAHDPGPEQRHTAELVVLTRWEAFAPWADASQDERRAEYDAFKVMLEEKLLRQFGTYFPALVPLIVYHEVSTPLTLTGFTGAQHGAMYGLEVTPRRFLSAGLHCKTPIPGLYLAGQDAGAPGVHGAMMGGLMAAAAIEPRVFAHLG
jgi:all-trans-retinol 13,14-reductase